MGSFPSCKRGGSHTAAVTLSRNSNKENREAKEPLIESPESSCVPATRCHEEQQVSSGRKECVREVLPLSRRQERMFFMQMANPKSRAFNLGLCFTLECKAPDKKLPRNFLELISNAIRSLVAYHPKLRASIVLEDTFDTPSRLGQVVCDTGDLDICSLRDNTSPSPRKKTKIAKGSESLNCNEIVCRELDLSKQPFHCLLYKQSSRKVVIVFTFHHIVVDGTSLYILSQDLITLLCGRSLGPASTSCSEDGSTQRLDDASESASSRNERKLIKWITLLDSARRCTSFPKTDLYCLTGGCVHLPIPPTTSTALAQLTHLTNVSVVVVLSSMFVCALAKFTSYSDIIIGMVSANRGRGTKGVVDYLVNTLPLRVDFKDESHSKTLADLLKHVKRNWGMILDGSLDLADLLPHVDCLKHQGESSIYESPLQVLFSYYSVTEGNPLPVDIKVGGVEVTCNVHSPKPGHAHTDLVLEVDPTKRSSSDEQLFAWEYRETALTTDQVQSLHELLCKLIEAACEACRTGSVRTSPLLLVPDSSEASDGIVIPNVSILHGPARVSLESRRPNGQPLCFIERFHNIVFTAPEAPAFVFSEGYGLSYKETNVLATEFALLLRDEGVLPGDHVGLHLSRSHWVYITILAILKCACVYVPINTYCTEDEKAKILEFADIKLVIVSLKFKNRFNDFEGRVVDLDENILTLKRSFDEPKKSVQEYVDQIGISYNPEQICFILFTSGTTGEPKGVAITERNLHTTLDNFQSLFTPRDTEITLAAANVSFDGHVADALFPLVNCSCLVVAENITDLSNADAVRLLPALTRITYTFAPPSAASVVKFPKTMRALKVGGEMFSPACFYNTLHIPKVINGYGPTETTVFVSTNRLPRPHEMKELPSDEEMGYIGSPVPNCRLLVLDESLRAVPIGTRGTLHVVGPNVSDVGYYGCPDDTQKVFFPLKSCDIIPMSCDITPESHDQARYGASVRGTENLMVHCTGDLVKALPNGKLQFLGRADYQVKLRGVRFHLIEVEQALGLCESVSKCVVFVKGHGSPAALLVACVTPEDVNLDRVREFAISSLPVYMVPSRFLAFDEFPLTETGKINRKHLKMIVQSALQISAEENRNDSEQSDSPKETASTESKRKSLSLVLSKIFAGVLEMGRFDPQDDFFANGGHSLLTFQLLREVNRQIGSSLTLTHILQHTTPSQLAAAILSQQEWRVELDGTHAGDLQRSIVDEENVVSFETAPQLPILQEVISSNTASVQSSSLDSSDRSGIFNYLKPVPDIPFSELLREKLELLFQAPSQLPRSNQPRILFSDASLNLEDLSLQLESASGIHISASSLAHYSSLDMLQSHYKLRTILSFKSQSNKSSVVELISQRSPEETPLFFIHAGIIGWALPYCRLAQQVGVYSVAIQHTADAPEDTFERKASFYLEKIKSVQRDGPYKLIGVCYGALLVYEIARQLCEDGERVELAVLIDNSPLPESLPTLFARGEIPLQGTVLHPYTFLETSLGLDFSKFDRMSLFTKTGVKCEDLVASLLTVCPWLPFTGDELVSAYYQFFLPLKAVWCGKYRPKQLIGNNVGSVVLVRNKDHPLFESHDYGLLRLVNQDSLSVIVPNKDLTMLNDKTTRDCIAKIIRLYL